MPLHFLVIIVSGDHITFDNFLRVTENKQNLLLSEDGNCAYGSKVYFGLTLVENVLFCLP